MELREALSHIAEIRLRMAETELFRGYRSLPIACSGLFAVIAAAIQPILIPRPAEAVAAFCLLWIVVAVASMGGAGLTMWLRDRFGGASQTREVTMLALSQLFPSLVAGGLFTAAIVRLAPEHAALLPGLWQVFLSLGLFASYRLLPRASVAVAGFYLVSGIAVVALGQGEWTLHPWLMGLPFGIGQCFAALVLYFTLERTDEEA